MEIAFDKDDGSLHDMQKYIGLKSTNPATERLYSKYDLEELYLINFDSVAHGLSSDNDAEKESSWKIIKRLAKKYKHEDVLFEAIEMFNPT